MKAEISKSHAAFKTSGTQLQNDLADLESSVRILVWQVSILLVGATLVRIIFSSYSCIQY